ncbi:Mechanosensitive ion channel-domain-containing protein [Phycomyces nitens]|nr:Mechanosensitive ion channel-domain-containing protein [Phycomyces nitens]
MARQCCWHYLSPLIRRIILALSGSCMFAAIGVCIYLFLPYPTEEEKRDPNFRNVRSNVQCWMYWAAFMWHIGWVTTIVIELIPTVVSTWTKIFKGRRSESVKTYMEASQYYMSLKWYTGLLTMVSWNWGTWAFLLQYPFPSVHKQDYSRIIWNVYACVFVATCFLFIQKLIIQVIATSFHSFAFNDRVQESKNALKILDSLSRAETRRARQDFANRLRIRRPLSSRISFAPDDSTPTLNNLTTYSATSVGCGQKSDTKRLSNTPEIFSQFQKRLQSIVLTDQPQSRSLIDNDRIDINSIEFAKKVARKLFQSLAYPVGTPLTGEEDSKRSLDVSDFRPFFDTVEEAKSAFAVFDRDGNGDLTRREFRDTVVQIYRERKALAQSMRDTSQALGKIDAMLLLISIIATVFVSLAVFNVEIWHSLVPLGSFLLALTFVFGNTAKNTFESILFLFVTHPYDAGDLVIIDEQFLMVHNLGLMGTVFIRGDGQRIYAPTTVLMTKLITNVRRSGNMGETIQINIDFRTPTESIYKLRDQVSEWVNGETRDFAGFDLRVLDIVDVNQILINLWLPYKGNWQELSKRWQRRTRFMLALKGILTDLNIRYELPTQKFTQAQEDRTFLNPNSPLSGNNSVIEIPQSFGHFPSS